MLFRHLNFSFIPVTVVSVFISHLIDDNLHILSTSCKGDIFWKKMFVIKVMYTIRHTLLGCHTVVFPS